MKKIIKYVADIIFTISLALLGKFDLKNFD